MGKLGQQICLFVGIAALAATVIGCGNKTEPAEVVISLDEAVQPLTSAKVVVDYSKASAKPQIAGGSPACFALPPDVTADFSDDGAGHLTIDVRARRAFAAPIDLAVCRMIPDSADIAAATISASLAVTLSSATDTKGEQLDDRRLAMTRSGGRDVATAAPSGSSNGTGGTGTGTNTGRPSSGGSAATAHSSGSGSGSGAGSLGESLRQRNTGNAAKELEREAERAARAAERVDKKAADASGRGGNAADAANEALGTPDPDAENDPGVSRSTPSYDVTAEVLNNAGLLGALQFDINHTGASGGWQGAGGGVRCQWQTGGGLQTCNDIGGGRVRCALVEIAGIQTPTRVVTCTFKTSDSLSASNFDVSVVDASTPDFDPASPNMAVTSVAKR